MKSFFLISLIIFFGGFKHDNIIIAQNNNIMKYCTIDADCISFFENCNFEKYLNCNLDIIIKFIEENNYSYKYSFICGKPCALSGLVIDINECNVRIILKVNKMCYQNSFNVYGDWDYELLKKEEVGEIDIYVNYKLKEYKPLIERSMNK